MKTRIDADVIIPVSVQTFPAYLLALTALRTCRASTGANMLILENNSGGSEWAEKLRHECEITGIRCAHVDGPFNSAKFFNIGTRLTNSKYVALACQDVIYFDNWLENIIALWTENPSYYAMCNWSFHPNKSGACCENEIIEINRVVREDNPSSGCLVLRRADKYVWDERFAWQPDGDFMLYLEANGLKAGRCCNARCDHLIGGVLRLIASDPDGYKIGDENSILREKWGSLYKGI